MKRKCHSHLDLSMGRVTLSGLMACLKMRGFGKNIDPKNKFGQNNITHFLNRPSLE